MRNWTIKEAIEGINANDTVAIKEISKHFPEFFLAVARNDMAALAAMMPEKFTVRRLVAAGAVTNEAADTDEGETNESVADDADLSAMSTKELIALCGQRGIKVPKYGKNKQFYLDALGAAADGEGDEPESDEDDDGKGSPYEGKSAMELFKECKKRGLKAEPKKKAAYYAELLDKDNAKADDEDAGDDEDWSDGEADEEPKKAPTKKAPTKKAPAKKESKPASNKAKAQAEDDDDDWDI